MRGDQVAWTRLVERYAGLVNTVARRAGLSSYDAEDCGQHTWMALYRHRSAIRDPERLPGWLALTTRRQAVRMLRRRYRETDLLAETPPTEGSALPDEELLAIERQDALEHAIAQLDDRCREVLTALFLDPEEASYQDIADRLGLSPNTMGSLRSRCLKRLRSILEKVGYRQH